VKSRKCIQSRGAKIHATSRVHLSTTKPHAPLKIFLMKNKVPTMNGFTTMERLMLQFPHITNARTRNLQFGSWHQHQEMVSPLPTSTGKRLPTVQWSGPNILKLSPDLRRPKKLLGTSTSPPKKWLAISLPTKFLLLKMAVNWLNTSSSGLSQEAMNATALNSSSASTAKTHSKVDHPTFSADHAANLATALYSAVRMPNTISIELTMTNIIPRELSRQWLKMYQRASWLKSETKRETPWPSCKTSSLKPERDSPHGAAMLNAPKNKPEEFQI